MMNFNKFQSVAQLDMHDEFQQVQSVAQLDMPEPSMLFGKCVDIPEPIHAPEHNSTQRANNVELDIHGLPWDGRIHARTKTKNKDGSWKKLRTVSNVTVDKIESELKTVQDISAPPAPPPTDTPVKTFADMMTLITTSITNKTLERIDVNKVMNQFGIPFDSGCGNSP